MQRFRIEDGDRRTLTVRLREALGLSHRQARELVLSGRVQAGGEPIRDPAWRPAEGAEIAVLDPAAGRGHATIVGPGFRVVHLDRDLVAIDKEPGVVVVPTSDPSPDDLPLVARVVAALKLAGHRVDGLHVVHRIDRETSGLVLFARHDRAWTRLRRSFRERRPEREYLAVTEGIPRPKHGELVHWLAEEPGSHRIRAVDDPVAGAVEARSCYRVEATRRHPPRAFLRVRLVTGRRNQIRAQCAAAGWPIVGDRWFGAHDPGPGRSALHAARLALPPEALGRPRSLVLEAPLPDDLARLCRRWFGDQLETP